MDRIHFCVFFQTFPHFYNKLFKVYQVLKVIWDYYHIRKRHVIASNFSHLLFAVCVLIQTETGYSTCWSRLQKICRILIGNSDQMRENFLLFFFPFRTNLRELTLKDDGPRINFWQAHTLQMGGVDL